MSKSSTKWEKPSILQGVNTNALAPTAFVTDCLLQPWITRWYWQSQSDPILVTQLPLWVEVLVVLRAEIHDCIGYVEAGVQEKSNLDITVGRSIHDM